MNKLIKLRAQSNIKTIVSAGFMLVLSSNQSCQNPSNNSNSITEDITVTKNCSGSYISFNQNDYYVCNSNTLLNYPQGQILNVTFLNIPQCSSFDNPVGCAQYGLGAGTVTIQSIN